MCFLFLLFGCVFWLHSIDWGAIDLVCQIYKCSVEWSHEQYLISNAPFSIGFCPYDISRQHIWLPALLEQRFPGGIHINSEVKWNQCIGTCAWTRWWLGMFWFFELIVMHCNSNIQPLFSFACWLAITRFIQSTWISETYTAYYDRMQVEHALPQQYIHAYNDGQFVTTPVSHSGA